MFQAIFRLPKATCGFSEYLKYFPVHLDFRQSNRTQHSLVDQAICRLPEFPDCPEQMHENDRLCTYHEASKCDRFHTTGIPCSCEL